MQIIVMGGIDKFYSITWTVNPCLRISVSPLEMGAWTYFANFLYEKPCGDRHYGEKVSIVRTPNMYAEKCIESHRQRVLLIEWHGLRSCPGEGEMAFTAKVHGQNYVEFVGTKAPFHQWFDSYCA